MELRPIATVRSTRTEPLDDHWDDERATIVLDASVPDEALGGLEAFSHVVVLFLFDRATDVPPGPWARHPRGDPRYPMTGIFAQRAKDRPNRLGLAVCRLVAVRPRELDVADLDAIEGTPVVDLKPHLAQLGPRGEVRQPAWVDELMADYFGPRASS